MHIQPRIRRAVLCAAAAVLLGSGAPARSFAKGLLPTTGTAVGKLIIGTGPINRFPPAFIATHYQMGQTFSESLMARVRAYNPGFFITGYISANLHPREAIYTTNNLHEERFLHACDPALLHAITTAGRVDLWWLADRRPELAGSGSAVYRKLPGDASGVRLATLPAGVATFTDTTIPAGTTGTYWIVTRSTSGVEYTYSDSLSATASASGPGWGALQVTVTVATDSVTLALTVDADPGITSPVLLFDRNADRTFGFDEHYALRAAGAGSGGRTQYTITIRGAATVVGSGYGYVVVDEGGSSAPSIPGVGNATTNFNNRVRSKTYGYYAMDLADPDWIAVVVDSVGRKMDLGYSGVFMDEMVPTIAWLELDSAVLGVTDAQYKDLCLSLMQQVGTIVAPKPIVYNGAPDNEFYAYADAGMIEGFTVAPWHTNGYLPFDAWQGQMNDCMRAVQLSRKGVLTLLRCDPTDVPRRMYGFASFLLTKGEYEFLNVGFEDTTTVYLPEWDLALGPPVETYPKVSLYKHGSGLYGRRYEKALVLVNPSETTTYAETLPQTMYRVDPIGGVVPELGGNGDIVYTAVTSVSLAPRSAAILVISTSGQP